MDLSIASSPVLEIPWETKTVGLGTIGFRNDFQEKESTSLPFYINNPVHEHNHTRILVPEVLCSLVDPETQNVPSTLATS